MPAFFSPFESEGARMGLPLPRRKAVISIDAIQTLVADLPLRGPPEDVMDDIIRELSRMVMSREVQEFCIDRADDLDATSHGRGCDEVVLLYEGADRLQAAKVERALIEAFRESDKCASREPKAEPSSDGGRRVFVALWFKEESRW